MRTMSMHMVAAEGFFSLFICKESSYMDYRVLSLPGAVQKENPVYKQQDILFHRAYLSGFICLFSRTNSRFTTSNRRTSSFISCSW